jgi:hypothetical protein
VPNDPVLHEGLSQWQDLALKTTEDRVMKAAIMLAMLDGGPPKTMGEWAMKVGKLDRYFPAAREIVHKIMNTTAAERELLAEAFEQQMEENVKQGTTILLGERHE